MLISHQFISPAINHFMSFSLLSVPTYTSGGRWNIFYIEINLYNTFRNSIIIIVCDSGGAQKKRRVRERGENFMSKENIKSIWNSLLEEGKKESRDYENSCGVHKNVDKNHNSKKKRCFDALMDENRRVFGWKILEFLLQWKKFTGFSESSWWILFWRMRNSWA